jgi:transcriptional regulator NrdR family protein
LKFVCDDLESVFFFQEERIPYVFFVNEEKIKNALKAALEKDEISTEHIRDIVHQQQAVF